MPDSKISRGRAQFERETINRLTSMQHTGYCQILWRTIKQGVEVGSEERCGMLARVVSRDLNEVRAQCVQVSGRSVF